MKVFLVFSVVICATVDSNDINKLKTTPKGQHINWNEYMGKWYVYANLHTCRWSGSAKFTDWASYSIMSKHSTNYTILEEWRKDGPCTRTQTMSTPTSPGCYNVVDQIGDLWSGKVVVVDMDKGFRHYATRWGCVRYIGDSCADYWVNVKTRYPNPGPYIVQRINRKLMELWDISLGDMALVVHIDPCSKPVPYHEATSKHRWDTY